MVKWLRQRPLTPLTSVRIRYGSPALRKLHIVRFRLKPKAYLFRCSSLPLTTTSLGCSRLETGNAIARRFHSQPLRWVARGERRENSKIALDKWKKRSIIEMFSGQPDDRYTKRTEQKPSEADFVRNIQLVLIAVRVHLFPSRTQKLSSLAPTILCGRLHGKIGNANIEKNSLI